MVDVLKVSDVLKMRHGGKYSFLTQVRIRANEKLKWYGEVMNVPYIKTIESVDCYEYDDEHDLLHITLI